VNVQTTKLCLFALLLFIVSPITINAAVSVATLQDLQAAVGAAPTTAPENETPTEIVITANIDNIVGTGAAVTIPAGANIALTTNQPQSVIIRRTEGTGRHFAVNGRLVLNDGITITSVMPESGSRGGVAINAGGTFVMYGGEIRSNRMAGNGGGVLVNGGRFYMYGGRITENRANGGAGVFVFTNGTFTMRGGTISENGLVGPLGGGGVRLDGANGVFTMTGGKISDNYGIAANHIGGSAIRANNAANRVNISDTVTIAGELYGVNSENFTMLPNSVLRIPANDTLTMQDATILTNNGTILNSGRIINRDNIEGTGIIKAKLTIEGRGIGTTESGFHEEDTFIALEEGDSVGHNFASWVFSLDDDEVTVSDQYTFDMPYNALTVTAEWDIMTFIVTFNTQGGSVVADQTVNHGALAAPPATPSRLGYTFVGWFADEAATIPWVFLTGIITSDTTIYAGWNIHNQILTINNVATEGNPTQSGNVQVGTLVVLEEGFRTGYDFTGWTIGWGNIVISDTNTFVMPAQEVMLIATWATSTHLVTFNFQDGRDDQDTIVNHGTRLIEPVPPTREYYTFEGWYTSETFDIAWNFDTDVVILDMTLYARWNMIAHLVTFDSRGGSLVNDTVVNYGTLITEPAPPTLIGHTFEGWYTSETFDIAWNFNTDVVTSDTTLFAKWEIITHVVTFNSQGGSLVNDTVVNFGTLVTAPPPPTRAFYIFGGWFADEATTIPWTFATSQVVSDTTLFARWNPHNEMLTISNLAIAGGPTQSGAVQVGTLVVLEEGERTGFNFAGWAVLSGGVTISDTNTFVMPGNAVVLMANWQPAGTNIAEMQFTASLQVYPNPVMDELRITTDELRIGDIVELFNMNGRRVFAQPVCQSSIVSRQFTIDMSRFPSGIYILRIGDQTVRIVKQ